MEKFLTVQELIDELLTIEDKSLPILGYVIDEVEDVAYDICRIVYVDKTIDDRIDLNIILEK